MNDEHQNLTNQGDMEKDHPDASAPGNDVLLQLLESAQRNLETVRQILAGQDVAIHLTSVRSKAASMGSATDQEGMKIIEGVFDGQNMVGPDGKQYSVPANYASKSKLVEGDVLKLSITGDGSFIYKQIGPIDRQRLIGVLTRDEVTNEYKVLAGGQAYKVLLASITYFKGEPGDEVVVLVPQAGEARWAAVENIIKKTPAV